MADRRVSDQLFHVGLHESNQSAIDNADQRQHHDPRGIAMRLIGEEADIETQQAVSAHFQQHPGEQYRSGGGRFDVRIRKPGVKREERDLYREGNEEAEEEPERSVLEAWHAAAANCTLNDDEIEAAGLGIEPENRRQHEHRADHGEEEILHRGVDLASVAVHADQEGHGNQRRFQEEVEQEQVELGKDADQSRLQNQEQDEEFLYALVNRAPGNEHAQGREKSGQYD